MLKCLLFIGISLYIGIYLLGIPFIYIVKYLGYHYIYLVGGFFYHPVLKNDGLRQLGWWQKPNMNGKIQNWWQPNHQPVVLWNHLEPSFSGRMDSFGCGGGSKIRTMMLPRNESWGFSGDHHIHFLDPSILPRMLTCSCKSDLKTSICNHQIS